MENINYFDLIIFTLVTLLGLKGLFRGFIKEFFALVGIVGGVFIASRVAANTGELIADIIPIENNNTMLLAGFIASLIVVWLAAYFIGIIFSKIFSLSGLGIFDRVLGFLFGAGKVFLLFSIITYAVSNIEVLSKKLKKTTNGSIAYPILVETGSYIIKIDTEKLHSKISNKVDDIVQSTKNGINTIEADVITQKVKEIKKEIVDEKK